MCFRKQRPYTAEFLKDLYLGPLLFLLYINQNSQALPDSHAYLNADDTTIFDQHKDVTGIGNVLIKEFANVCERLIDNKLPIHFGEDNIKCILFSKEKTCRSLTYDNNRIKQIDKVKYLGYWTLI